jgi:GDP-L-fucose synthase
MCKEQGSNFWHGKRVAVLGGAGMIGSHLVDLLIEAGAEVTVADDLSRGRRQNLTHREVEFKYTDLRTIHNLQAVKGKYAVFNLAARTAGLRHDPAYHSDMFLDNMLLQTVPLWACVTWNVPLYLQVSTLCVYPENAESPIIESVGQLGEPESRNSGYAWAKRMGERYAQWVHRATGMGVGIIRLSNCFGPRDYFDPRTSHVIPALIKRALEDDIIRNPGTGNEVRDFLYVRDAARAAMKVLEHYAEAYVLNVGNPNNRASIREVGTLIQNILFGPDATNHKAMRFSTEGIYSHRVPDIGKLVEVTAWQPETSLFDGLCDTIDWYQENKELAERSKF